MDRPRTWLLCLLSLVAGVAIGVFSVPPPPEEEPAPPPNDQPAEPKPVVAVEPTYLNGLKLYPGTCRDQSAPIQPMTEGVKPVVEKSALPTWRLTLEDYGLARLRASWRYGEAELDRDPGGRRPYYAALLRIDGGPALEVEVASRGLTNWHRHPMKPSLRVKLKKDDAIDGARTFDLIRPKDPLTMTAWLPERLARDFGLMSATSDHVRVYIDGKFAGVYLRSHRPGDKLAELYDRMPGAFLKGEQGWSSIALWNQHGDVTGADVKALDTLRATFTAPITPQSVLDVRDQVDVEGFANREAFNVVVRSVHTDAEHNHMLYRTSYIGKFESVPWDPVGFAAHNPSDLPVDVLLNPIHAVLYRDPRFVHRRNVAIAKALAGPASAERIRELARERLERLMPDLSSDPHLGAVVAGKGSCGVRVSPADLPKHVAKLEAQIDERSKFLTSYLADAKASVVPHPKKSGWSRVTAFGRIGVRLKTKDEKKTPNVTLALPGLGSEIRFTELDSPDGGEHLIPYVDAAALAYDVDVPPDLLVLENAITKAAVTPSEAPATLDPTLSYHPDKLTKDVPDDVVIGPGVIRMRGRVSTREGQTLRIQPGTRLLLEPGTSIIARGKVIAEGTKEAPIRVAPAGDEPWGTFGVIGAGTEGSVFRHFEVEGGGSGTDGRVELKGMFNVYGSPHTVIEDAKFGRNERGDDAVNLALGRYELRRVRFERARRDALDIDFADATLDDVTVIDAGNDAIDLMMAKVTIRNADVRGSKDKGASIGERSTVRIENCRFTRNAIGIEVKDASRLVVTDTALIENDVGLHSYRKKWRYGTAGSTALVRTTFRGSGRADLDLERSAVVHLIQTRAPHVIGRERPVQRPKLGPPFADL